MWQSPKERCALDALKVRAVSPLGKSLAKRVLLASLRVRDNFGHKRD
jgi:hypothetical protein